MIKFLLTNTAVWLVVMLSLDANNYDAWKKDCAGFFNRHKDLFANIIKKKYYYGHLNDNKLKDLTRVIAKRMNSKSVRENLKTYNHKASFLVFYIKNLENEITDFSQEEDIMLLNTAPQNLILKYKPLIRLIITKIGKTRKDVLDIQNDLEQEIVLSFINKTDYIKRHYKPDMLFRNYFWSIVNYSLLNQLKSKKWKKYAGASLDHVFDLADKNDDHDVVFCLNEGFRQLGEIMISYGKKQAKLELCLKALLSIPSSCIDLYALFGNNNIVPPIHELEEACMDLNNKIQAAGFSQIQRFSIICPLLNMAFKTKSKANSYLHWTNCQFQIIIDKLNKGGVRCFNRETFSIFLEMYFMKYCDGKALNVNTKGVYIYKEEYKRSKNIQL